MPEWLEKELIQWAQSQEWFSKMTRVSFLSLQIGMRKTFELMSEQQKPRPMEAYFDSRPDYEKEILILTDLGCVSAWFCEEDHNWVCLDDSFQLDLHEAKSWLELPTLEGL